MHKAYRQAFGRWEPFPLLNGKNPLQHPKPSILILGNLLGQPHLDGEIEREAITTLKSLARGLEIPAILAQTKALERIERQLHVEQRADKDGVSLAAERNSAIALLIAATRKFDDSLCARSRFTPAEESLPHAVSAFGLDEVEARLLHLITLLSFDHPLYRAYERLFENYGSVAAAYAAMLGTPLSAVRARLHPDRSLQRAGLIELDRNFGTHCFSLTRFFRNVMLEGIQSPEALIAQLLGKPATTTLEPGDFAHLGHVTDHLVRLLSRAGRQGEVGINVLLYGPPGTGKTEYAKLLAQLAGLPIHAIGESDDQGGEPTRRERLAAYKSFQHLMSSRAGEVLCLVDEAEEVFSGGGYLAAFFGLRHDNASKVFANRLFEQNPVPTIWIVNHVAALPETIRRRMNAVLHIDLPPAYVRAEILRKILAREGVTLAPRRLREIAERYPVTPAVYARAAKAAALIGHEGFGDAFTETLEGLCETLGVSHNAAPGAFAEETFDPALSEASLDLERMTANLVRSGKPFSLCLHGVPGTGKSAFAAHLARALGMEPFKLRASDLMSKYVGETEQNIRRAFQRARRNRTFLILDEADSLLRDRNQAIRSWEVTQVNELLVAMEQHPLPFACTTNLVTELDAASLRRFTFSVEFRPLPPEKAAHCFFHFFGLEAPAALSRLTGLVPSDFGIVRRRAEILGGLEDPNQLVGMLRDELAKRGAPVTPRVGFDLAVAEGAGRAH